MVVIAGSASPKLSTGVAKQLGHPLVKPELTRFPDGEFYVRADAKLEGEHAIVVQSTPYPQSDNLVELCLLLDLAKDLGAPRVTAVVPYLAYARQDKRFKPGEAISVRTVCKLIEHSGASDVFTVDVHEVEVMRNFACPAYNLTAMPLIGKYLAKLDLHDPIIIAPDEGASPLAKRIAVELMADHDYLEKRRVTPTQVEVRPKRLSVSNRDVVIVDDIISTGGTIIEAAKILKKQGARRLYAACTHPVFAGKALKKVLAAGVKKVVATDTIEHRTSVVSVASVIAEAIR